jgi:hypothetical protein
MKFSVYRRRPRERKLMKIIMRSAIVVEQNTHVITVVIKKQMTNRRVDLSVTGSEKRRRTHGGILIGPVWPLIRIPA